MFDYFLNSIVDNFVRNIMDLPFYKVLSVNLNALTDFLNKKSINKHCEEIKNCIFFVLAISEYTNTEQTSYSTNTTI